MGYGKQKSSNINSIVTHPKQARYQAALQSVSVFKYLISLPIALLKVKLSDYFNANRCEHLRRQKNPRLAVKLGDSVNSITASPFAAHSLIITHFNFHSIQTSLNAKRGAYGGQQNE